jgi:hypothetical protein
MDRVEARTFPVGRAMPLHTPKQILSIARAERLEVIDGGHTLVAHVSTACGEPIAVLLPRSVALVLMALIRNAVPENPPLPFDEAPKPKSPVAKVPRSVGWDYSGEDDSRALIADELRAAGLAAP